MNNFFLISKFSSMLLDYFLSIKKLYIKIKVSPMPSRKYNQIFVRILKE
jgi:hypothetical protein